MDIDRVDPELRGATTKLPVPDPARKIVRTAIRLATRVMPVAKVEGVTARSSTVAGLRRRIYTPEVRRHKGALLWIHGGGLLFGDARQDEKLCAETSRDEGIVVVSVNYRFAPDHPFPAAHEDVLESWRWIHQNAAELGIDPSRVVIGGESAGAGLAAALIQRIHDDGGIQPLGQWLFAPMLDDRTAADESLDALDHWVWNNRANRVGWRGYLGSEFGADRMPDYSVAARRTNLGGLPPAYIAVGDIELFFHEDQDYARRLEGAGVDVTFDSIEGAPHGFENWASETRPARDLMVRAKSWLRDVFENN